MLWYEKPFRKKENLDHQAEGKCKLLKNIFKNKLSRELRAKIDN